jgi:chemotaxis protein MotA
MFGVMNPLYKFILEVYMDIASVGGLLAGWAAVIIGIAISGGTAKTFVDIPSVFITGVGSLAALFISFSMGHLKKLVPTFKIMLSPPKFQPAELINLLVNFSEKARREGLLALEDYVEQIDDKFMRKGIQLVVDGTDPELVRNILNAEVEALDQRHYEGRNLWDQWAALAPAFGLIGTLIGLIVMLTRLEDKASIGAGMSVALLTSLYGAVMANLMFAPISKKLEMVNNEEILMREIMIEGILSIQSGDNPRIVKDKLASYLSPSQRDLLAADEVRG